MLKISIALVLLVFTGCTSEETITISSNNITLTYGCNNFQPQAKTQEQTLALLEKSISVLNEALERDDVALYRSLRTARQLRDIRRVEELIVQFECEKKLKR